MSSPRIILMLFAGLFILSSTSCYVGVDPFSTIRAVPGCTTTSNCPSGQQCFNATNNVLSFCDVDSDNNGISDLIQMGLLPSSSGECETGEDGCFLVKPGYGQSCSYGYNSSCFGDYNCVDGVCTDGWSSITTDDWYYEPESSSYPDEICDNYYDDDNDGLWDCEDPDCNGSYACIETENCSNGYDDDGDGYTDCEDSYCVYDDACLYSSGTTNGCEGHCGGESPAGCYCDASCVQYNDCCDNACSLCGHCTTEDGCTPNCSGKQCGPNGCGGTCGNCSSASTCNESGQCVWDEEEEQPTAEDCNNNQDDDLDGYTDCSDADCYTDSACQGGGTTDSCEGSCGGQAASCYCDEACIQYGDCCTDVCAACGLHCDAREGSSSSGTESSGTGACPSGLTFEGCCEGSTLTWCENDEIVTLDCQMGCGVWNSEAGFYDCFQEGETQPVPEPTGTFPVECVN